MERLGYELSKQELDVMYQRFLAVADKKQEVLDEDLLALVHDELPPVEQNIKLQYLHSYSGTTAIPTATVRLKVNGKIKERASVGDGPVDAVYKAIAALTSAKAKLLRYDIPAITEGTEAMGEVTVQLEIGNRMNRVLIGGWGPPVTLRCDLHHSCPGFRCGSCGCEHNEPPSRRASLYETTGYILAYVRDRCCISLPRA